jgi:pimeloyl-ACP methyl ester carboxylesterase
LRGDAGPVYSRRVNFKEEGGTLMRSNILGRLTIASAVFLTAGCCCTNRSPEACAAEKSAASRSHFASFGTNRIHYVTAGEGTNTLVLIHCWCGNLGLWREQIPALTNKARLILVDLPGHGQSDKPQTQYTPDLFANAVLAVLRDAGVDRATFIGHSMGAPVVCRIYAQAPDKVAALVAVDGLLRRPPATPEQAAQFVAQFHAPDYRVNASNFIRTMFPIPGTEALRDQVIADLLTTPQYVMAGAMDGMFGADQPDWGLKSVAVPMIVISVANPLYTEDYVSYVRSLSTRLEYRTIQGAGHWVMLEKPAEFNTTLIELLSKYDLIGK